MPISFKHLLARFCICVAVLKDVSGDQWDPLPAGVRSVVSSNHLSESSPPRIFPEYHALLPYFRGDYGVKTELIDAASEEPVYKGVETDLLPLYIPRGAIPLAVNQRRVRSGGDPGIANMRVLKGPSPSIRDSPTASSINRSVRRVFTPIRRPPSGARPTPPAAYLSPWIRRRNGSPTSAAEEDDVEEARKTKQKLLSQLDFKKRMEASDDERTTTAKALLLFAKDEVRTEKNSDVNKESKSNVPSKTVTSVENLSKNKTLLVSSSSLPFITTPSSRIKESPDSKDINANLTVFVKLNSTQGSEISSTSNYNRRLNNLSTTVSTPRLPTSVSTSERNRTSKIVNTSTETPAQFGIKQDSHTLKNETTIVKAPSLIRRRPVVMETKLEAEGRRIVPARNGFYNSGLSKDFDSLKTSANSSTTTSNTTTAATAATTTIATTTSTTTTTTTTLHPPVITTTIFPSLRIKESTPESRTVSKTQDLLMRRRVSIMKGLTLNKQVSNSNNSSSSQSIIDRVLNIAANHENGEVRDYLSTINSSSIDVTVGNPIIKSALVPVDGSKILNYNSYNISKSNSKGVLVRETRLPIKVPPVFSNVSVSSTTPRVKIPLRRRPIVSNPVKSTTPTLASFTSTTLSTQYISTTLPTTSTISTTTGSTFIVNKNSNQIFLPSRRHPGGSDSREKVQSNNQFSTNLITTSTPKLDFNFNVHSSPPLPPKLLNFSPSYRVPFANNEGVNKPITSAFLPMINMPKLKSPQDIVLEKLSELMKNATKGNRSSFDIIVEEIERLNKELGSMGIHIIDAEFGGQKIKLRDQVANRTGLNLPRATTITYFIPNTNNRSLIRNLEPHIVHHPPTSKDIRVGLSVPNDNENKTALFYNSSDYPDKANYSDRPSFTIRKYKTTIKPLLSTSDTLFSVQQTNLDKSPDNVDDVDEETIPTVHNIEKNSKIDKTFSTNTEAPKGTTFTRSTVLFNVQDTLHTTLPSSEGKNINETKITLEDHTIKNDIIKEVKPTAHRRPTVPKDSSNLSDITTAVSTNDELEPQIVQVEPDTNLIDSVKNPFPILISEYGTVLSKPDEEYSDDAKSYIYLIGIIGIVPGLAVFAYLYRLRQKRERKSLPEREEEVEGFTAPVCNIRPAGHNDTLDAFPGYIFETSIKRDSPWELSRSKLKLTSVIGEGNFGIVWKAEARNLCEWDEGGGPTVLVAVKGVKEGAGAKEKSDLLRELSIMQHLGQHPNIVTLLGCCTTQEPYFLVMEYVMFGKLLTFLREQRSKNNCFNFSSDSGHLTSRDLTKFAYQIATGCEYLQSRGVIHRDLAARNILLDHNKTCKIADFGLARSVKDMETDIYEQKSRGPLPIRWMAPESLFMNIFTHKSDVWSFGILCWEIVTLGSTPYPGISAREVMRRVREGYRLERPEHCRTEFYRIVTKCWHQDHTKRVAFSTVKDDLRDLLDNYSGWIDLENFQDSTYYSMHQNNEEKL